MKKKIEKKNNGMQKMLVIRLVPIPTMFSLCPFPPATSLSHIEVKITTRVNLKIHFHVSVGHLSSTVDFIVRRSVHGQSIILKHLNSIRLIFLHNANGQKVIRPSLNHFYNPSEAHRH